MWPAERRVLSTVFVNDLSRWVRGLLRLLDLSPYKRGAKFGNLPDIDVTWLVCGGLGSVQSV